MQGQKLDKVPHAPIKQDSHSPEHHAEQKIDMKYPEGAIDNVILEEIKFHTFPYKIDEDIRKAKEKYPNMTKQQYETVATNTLRKWFNKRRALGLLTFYCITFVFFVMLIFYIARADDLQDFLETRVYGNEDDYRDDVTNNRNYAIYSLVIVCLSTPFFTWCYISNTNDYFDHSLDRSKTWKYCNTVTTITYIVMVALLFVAHLGMWILSLVVEGKDYLGEEVLKDTGVGVFNRFQYINDAMQWLIMWWVGFYVLYVIAFRTLLKNPYDQVIAGLNGYKV